MKKRNIMHVPGASEKMSRKKKEFYKRHPEKHANVIMARSGRKGSFGYPSKPQKELFKLVKAKYPNVDVILEYPVRHDNGTFFLDVAVPSLKLDFEYDEPYWHPDVEADNKRDGVLGRLGWEVIRIRGDEVFV